MQLLPKVKHQKRSLNNNNIMKKLLLLALLAISVSVYSQRTMRIHSNGNIVYSMPVSNVDSIDFIASDTIGIAGEWSLDLFDFFGIYTQEETPQYLAYNVEFEYNAEKDNFGLREWADDDLNKPLYKLSHYDADTYFFESIGSADNPDGTVTFSDGTYSYWVEFGVVTRSQNKWGLIGFAERTDWAFIITNGGKTLEIAGAEGFRLNLSSLGLSQNALVYPVLVAYIYDNNDKKEYFIDVIGQPVFRSPDSPQSDFRTGQPATSSVKSVKNEKPAWAKNLDFSKAKQIPVKNIRNFKK
jgi:hypothetical protein